MPISHVIDEKQCQVHTTITGPITAKDIWDHLEVSRQKQTLGYAELIDARKAGRPFLSASELWQTAVSIRALKLPALYGPRAIVVADDTVYALSCLFAVGLMDLVSVSVFRNLRSAESWLDWHTEREGTAATT